MVVALTPQLTIAMWSAPDRHPVYVPYVSNLGPAMVDACIGRKRAPYVTARVVNEMLCTNIGFAAIGNFARSLAIYSYPRIRQSLYVEIRMHHV